MVVKLIARDMGLGALQIDPAYQRIVVPSQVKWIVHHYDEVAFGRLLVAHRPGPNDGSYWVVDGQQRLTAARELETDRVPCLVFTSNGRQHEASVFKEVNASRSVVKPMDVFRAALEAGDPEATAIDKAVRDCGFKIANVSRTDAAYWHYISAVTVMRNLYRTGGTELIVRTLTMLKEAWEGDVQACNGIVLSGLGLFLQKADGLYDRDRLVRKLKSQPPMDLVRYVKDVSRLAGSGKDRSRLFAGAILVLYNKGLRSGKLTVPGLGGEPFTGTPDLDD